jgi:Uma2 family endonuclease
MNVPLYWIIDPEKQSAEIWTPDAVTPVIEESRLVWSTSGAMKPLTIDLPKLFAR